MTTKTTTTVQTVGTNNDVGGGINIGPFGFGFKKNNNSTTTTTTTVTEKPCLEYMKAMEAIENKKQENIKAMEAIENRKQENIKALEAIENKKRDESPPAKPLAIEYVQSIVPEAKAIADKNEESYSSRAQAMQYGKISERCSTRGRFMIDCKDRVSPTSTRKEIVGDQTEDTNMVPFFCTGCGQKFKFRADKTGTKKCPNCGDRLTKIGGGISKGMLKSN